MVKINSLSKPLWKTLSGVKLCSLKLEKPELGKIRAEVSHLKDYNYAINLFTSNGTRIGKEFFGLYPDENRIFGFNIETLKSFRGKFRLGELLRLISIMEMIENKINLFQIFSKDTAVYFHFRYGFKPDIRQFAHRDNNLETISNDSRFPDFAQTAKILIKKIHEHSGGEEMRKICKLTSVLTEEYMKRVKQLNPQEQKLHPFTFGFDMKLTKEDVLKEKDLFNRLFKNHGIDYTI